MRLAITGPTRDTVPASFALHLAQLYATTREQGPWPSVTMGFEVATYVHVGREAALDMAIRCQATHVLWLDTDMAFPPDTAIRLAQHDVPIVGCNYVMRDPQLIWTARRDGRCLATDPASTGLEPVDSVGLAVLLMRTDVVRVLMRPWFRHGWNETTQQDIGEDVLFCRRLREAGHTIYIDHDVSKEIGHIGQHTFRLTADHQTALAV
jgi:hypothetical protein